MVIKQFRTGGDRNFGYLIADARSNEAVIIDPSFSPERLLDAATANGWAIRYAFCTHDHHDHTNGNTVVEKRLGAPVLLYGSTPPGDGGVVKDGARFPLGDLAITILHTPGHTPDSICLHIDDAVFTGDTLFVGKVGGTGLGEDARQEYASLHEKLLTLPDSCRVFPGHDYGSAPDSTIGRERTTNPFLTQPDFASFLHLKKTWPEYKKAHGIA